MGTSLFSVDLTTYTMPTNAAQPDQEQYRKYRKRTVNKGHVSRFYSAHLLAV